MRSSHWTCIALAEAQTLQEQNSQDSHRPERRRERSRSTRGVGKWPRLPPPNPSGGVPRMTPGPTQNATRRPRAQRKLSPHNKTRCAVHPRRFSSSTDQTLLSVHCLACTPKATVTGPGRPAPQGMHRLIKPRAPLSSDGILRRMPQQSVCTNHSKGAPARQRDSTGHAPTKQAAITLERRRHATMS